MKLSYNWLQTLVDMSQINPKQCAAALTMSGSKAETVEVMGDDIRRVVVGRVESLQKHPNADRLTICRVNIGGDQWVQIVTGATNLFEGALVPAALDGAVLPGGKEIHSGDMRGEISQGMLCSGSELQLDSHDQPGADADGILILEDGTPGQDITAALQLCDTVIDFEITNNRPDCLSVRGLARETAATFRRPLTLPAAKTFPTTGETGDCLQIRVEDPRLCPRYAARMVDNVTIKPSPQWMRRALRSMGVRPINNIVDITNYVMLEFGQPMHAFDYACLGGGVLVVRTAKQDEVLETLDGQNRRLDPSMLVIADGEKATAVAGVMGGASSEITETTRRIVFESACFDGVSVRKTAQTLGMRTDASSRFEKGLDPENVLPALERACELVELLGAGRVMDGRIDCYPQPAAPRSMSLPADKINALLGTALTAGDMAALIAPLGFAPSDNDGGGVMIPSWRSDVEFWQDLAEEVARMYGYDRIPATLTISKNKGLPTPWQLFRDRVSELCRALGYNEALTIPFIGVADLDFLGLPPEDIHRKAIAIQNPAGEETGLLRPFVLPSFIGAFRQNAHTRNPAVRLFELATVFIDKGEALPLEELRLALGAYGGGADYFTVKGDLESLLPALGCEALTFTAAKEGGYHPGRCARILLRGNPIGVLGELHPKVCEAMNLTARVCVMELALRPLFDAMEAHRPYSPLPKYPSTSRDIALCCPTTLPYADILEAIRQAGGGLLRSCALFDIYTGSHIPQGQRSLAFRLTFRADDRTLRDEEADEAVAAVLKELETRWGIGLRDAH